MLRVKPSEEGREPTTNFTTKSFGCLVSQPTNDLFLVSSGYIWCKSKEEVINPDCDISSCTTKNLTPITDRQSTSKVVHYTLTAEETIRF